jgi:Snf7
VDDIHNLMDDVAEQQEIANEISDAISNPVGFGQDVDDVSEFSPVLISVNDVINV